MASDNRTAVLVAGAGPVGLLIALRLGQAGIPTIVLESHHTLLPTTRAMVYMPVILHVLRGLGILQKVMDNAFLNHDGAVWRNIQGEVLAQLPVDGDTPGDFGGVLLIGQKKMNTLILDELKKYQCVQVRFGQKCVGIEDLEGEEEVKVMAHQQLDFTSTESSDGDITYFAKWVVGSDGANSAVRRMLCIPFEGFTYPGWKMIGVDVLYDFPKHEGYTPVNFIVDPVHWAVVAYTGEDEFGEAYGNGRPQWRIAYVEDPNLPGDKISVIERAYERMKVFITPGDGMDDKGKFSIKRAEPYVNHQRVAATGRKGRVLLAGDALHSNNPIGGLGLTTGICDAFCYGNALVRVINGGEGEDLLTHCADSRRWTWINATKAMSEGNLKRLRSTELEEVKARNIFFKRLNTEREFPVHVKKAFNQIMIDTFETKHAPMPKYGEELYLPCVDIVKRFEKSVAVS